MANARELREFERMVIAGEVIPFETFKKKRDEAEAKRTKGTPKAEKPKADKPHTETEGYQKRKKEFEEDRDRRKREREERVQAETEAVAKRVKSLVSKLNSLKGGVKSHVEDNGGAKVSVDVTEIPHVPESSYGDVYTDVEVVVGVEGGDMKVKFHVSSGSASKEKIYYEGEAFVNGEKVRLFRKNYNWLQDNEVSGLTAETLFPARRVKAIVGGKTRKKTKGTMQKRDFVEALKRKGYDINYRGSNEVQATKELLTGHTFGYYRTTMMRQGGWMPFTDVRGNRRTGAEKFRLVDHKADLGGKALITFAEDAEGLRKMEDFEGKVEVIAKKNVSK